MGCFLPHTCFGLTGPNDLIRTPMFRELHTHIFREKGGGGRRGRGNAKAALSAPLAGFEKGRYWDLRHVGRCRMCFSRQADSVSCDSFYSTTLRCPL